MGTVTKVPQLIAGTITEYHTRGLKASSAAAGIAAVGLAAALAAPPTLTGPVEAWAPPGISTSMFESHPAFDPRTGDLYFVRSSKAFTGWRILTRRCTASELVRPGVVSKARQGWLALFRLEPPRRAWKD